MPRHKRKKAEFTTYHIIQRGNERRNIFLSDEDKTRFIETLLRMKEKYNFLIYAYCLMDNHLHLVIYDNGNDISQLMKSINTSYVFYFNKIYRRSGHLFQDRFKSEIIKDDVYLLEVSKYIHNNPVKAGIVEKPEEYRWSSYNLYIGNHKNISNLVNTEKILGMISEKQEVAVKEYINFVCQTEESGLDIMDIDDDIVPDTNQSPDFIYTKDQALERIKEIAAQRNLTYEEIIKVKGSRDELIEEIRKNSLLTLKQIGEIFGGLSESRISKILGRKEKRTVPDSAWYFISNHSVRSN